MRAHLNSSLQSLDLDASGLEETIVLHVGHFAGIAIYTRHALACCVFCLIVSFILMFEGHRAHPQLGQRPDDIPSAILDKRPGDHLQRIRDRLVRRTRHARQRLCPLIQRYTDRHLGRSSPWRQNRIKHHIPRHRHRIRQVPVDFVENILARSAEEDGACLRGLAFLEEGKVLVAELVDVELAAFRPDVRFAQVLDAVDDGSSDGTGYAVVVGFADSADGGDVLFEEVVLGEIWSSA